MRIFIDSDVVISSLLSSSGAASILLRHTSNITLTISSLSQKEVEVVVKRLGIVKKDLDTMIEKKIEVVELEESIEKIRKKYKDYVTDENDAHIIAGGVKAKADFLVTYNLKHYKIDKIKTDFDMIVMTPAKFLQYLRSR